MLIHPTVERLRCLGLAAMADALVELQNNPEAAEMPHADWLGLLIDREVTFRDNRRLSRRLTAARLRQAATIENVDYRTSRGLDRSLFQTLATSQWVRDCNHLAIVGPTGTGKSWLACALGNKACRDGFSVLYKRASRLFADSRSGPRRRPSLALDEHARAHQSHHHRRLGTRAAHRRAGQRPGRRLDPPPSVSASHRFHSGRALHCGFSDSLYIERVIDALQRAVTFHTDQDSRAPGFSTAYA